MISREIQCTYCGLMGEIEAGHGPKKHDRNVFKHVGHNPFSGHLHYQCPSCSIVLLVPPMDVLGGKLLRGSPRQPKKSYSLTTALSSFFYSFAQVGKAFKTSWLSGGA